MCPDLKGPNIQNVKPRKWPIRNWLFLLKGSLPWYTWNSFNFPIYVRLIRIISNSLLNDYLYNFPISGKFLGKKDHSLCVCVCVCVCVCAKSSWQVASAIVIHSSQKARFKTGFLSDCARGRTGWPCSRDWFPNVGLRAKWEKGRWSASSLCCYDVNRTFRSMFVNIHLDGCFIYHQWKRKQHVRF